MDVLFNLPGLLIAIVIHELSHGMMAFILGDNTAKNAGRLTLNPIKHMDPMGFLFLLIFKFGWAKPVPINSSNFKNRRRDMILVSLAGPASNFIVAFIVGFILSLDKINNPILFKITLITLWYNIILGVFNLLPFPPLDGSKILASILPGKLEYYFYKYEKYLYSILLILIITNVIDKILGPLIDLAFNIIFTILS